MACPTLHQSLDWQVQPFDTAQKSPRHFIGRGLKGGGIETSFPSPGSHDYGFSRMELMLPAYLGPETS